MEHRTESPAVKSLQEERARQASADAEGKLQKGLKDTFPASDPVSATNSFLSQIMISPPVTGITAPVM